MNEYRRASRAALLRTAAGLALSLLCLPLLIHLPTIALLPFAHVLPRAVDPRYVLFAAQSVLLLTLLLLVRFPLTKTVASRPPPSGLWDAAVFVGGGMLVVLGLSVTAAQSATADLHGFSTLGLQRVIQERYPDGGLVGMAMYLGVMAPISEELLFRALILGALLRSAPPWFALVVSTTLFAAGHKGWPVAAFTGFSFGLLYLRYRNLWIPIVAHAAANLLGLLLPLYLVSQLNDAGLLRVFVPHLLPFQLSCIALACACYWMFFRRLLGRGQARQLLFDWHAAEPVTSSAIDQPPECRADSSSPPPTPASSASSASCSRRSAGR